LHIIGENLDVDAFVTNTKLAGFSKRYKGDPFGNSSHRKNKYSGASITTSSADFDNIKGQIDETIIFLSEHKPNLKVIASTLNVDHAWIDFGVDSTIGEDRLTQNFHFSKDLIKLCAELDIEIEISLYKEDIQHILEKKRLEKLSKS